MNTEFKPNYAIHPGELLLSDLEILDMSPKELSENTGIDYATIEQIIKEEQDMSPYIAASLENIFGYDTGYWLRLQSFYDETNKRLKDEINNGEPRI